MEKAVDQGYLKSIGVSNFSVKVSLSLSSCCIGLFCCESLIWRIRYTMQACQKLKLLSLLLWQCLELSNSYRILNFVAMSFPGLIWFLQLIITSEDCCLIRLLVLQKLKDVQSYARIQPAVNQVSSCIITNSSSTILLSIFACDWPWDVGILQCTLTSLSAIR